MNKSKSPLNSTMEQAKHRIENRKWLDYSSQIVRRILSAIEDKKGFKQTGLARLLNVSDEQISKIVKGQEDLSLSAIAKISEILEVGLITFPDYKDSFVEATTKPSLKAAGNPLKPRCLIMRRIRAKK